MREKSSWGGASKTKPGRIILDIKEGETKYVFVGMSLSNTGVSLRVI
jgi:hypothetical protein